MAKVNCFEIELFICIKMYSVLNNQQGLNSHKPKLNQTKLRGSLNKFPDFFRVGTFFIVYT